MADSKIVFEIHEDAKQFKRFTDPKFTKHVKGFGKPDFTNIDTYYLIQEATKQYGLFGSGFGFKETVWNELTLPDGAIILQLHAVFFFGSDGSFPISNSDRLYYQNKKGGWVFDTDLYKKLETNCQLINDDCFH